MLELEERTLCLDRYRLQHRLLQSGMSEIYLAYDERFQRVVAIKVVSKHQVEHIARFQQEIQAISKLTHPHILPILDYGEYSDWHYLVMPYIKQGTLRDRLVKGPLTQREVGIILEQIASALQFVHDQGIIHRDIKPSNILLDDGPHAYLADFGLVKVAGEPSDITQTGCLMGTPEYMAPELAYEPPGPHSDIYALGILLYRVLTGQLPFKAENPLAVYWKHIRVQPMRPSLVNPAISYSVEQVILKALEKDPGRRFKSAQELAQAYNRALKTPKVIGFVSAMVQNVLRKRRSKNMAFDYSTLPNARTLPHISDFSHISHISRISRPRPRGIDKMFAALVVLFFLLGGFLSSVFSALYTNGLTSQASPPPVITGASVQFDKSQAFPPTPQGTLATKHSSTQPQTPPQPLSNGGKHNHGHNHDGEHSPPHQEESGEADN